MAVRPNPPKSKLSWAKAPSEDGGGLGDDDEAISAGKAARPL